MISPTDSPLAAIREAERTAAERIDSARAEVVEQLRNARRRAVKLVSEAEERGRHTATRRNQEGIEAAQAEAERILGQGSTEATQLAEEVAPHLPAAVDALVDFLLPAPFGEEV